MVVRRRRTKITIGAYHPACLSPLASSWFSLHLSDPTASKLSQWHMKKPKTFWTLYINFAFILHFFLFQSPGITLACWRYQVRSVVATRHTAPSALSTNNATYHIVLYDHSFRHSFRNRYSVPSQLSAGPSAEWLGYWSDDLRVWVRFATRVLLFPFPSDTELFCGSTKLPFTGQQRRFSLEVT